MIPRVPKIAFITTLGINVGDEFIREGIRSFLDEVFPAYEPLYVNKHDMASIREPRLDETAHPPDKLTAADIIIQAGAPLYWKNAGSTCATAEWVEDIWRTRVFRRRGECILLNIGAGSGQAFGEGSRSVSGDAGCAEFIREVSAMASWESVRDPLASEILFDLGIRHDRLPCPAFHAARRKPVTPSVQNDLVAVNVMPLSGHYSFAPEVTEAESCVFHRDAISRLRAHHELLFVAHTTAEVSYMEQFRTAGERIFFSGRYLDYLPVYAGCKGTFANRVHGAVCAAGYGKPAAIVGNDSRLRIGEFIGMPCAYIASPDVIGIVDSFEDLLSNASHEAERLVSLRERSAETYRTGIRAALAAAG